MPKLQILLCAYRFNVIGLFVVVVILYSATLVRKFELGEHGGQVPEDSGI